MPTIMKLSGKMYVPEWVIFDKYTGGFLGSSVLTKQLANAMTFDSEEEARVEITHIIQHPDSYQLPRDMALTVISMLEAKHNYGQ